MGCDGCELWNTKTGVRICYAGTLHARFGGATTGYAPSFEQVTTFPGRMAEAAHWRDLCGTARKDKPWLNGLPRLIFISDMSDALSSVVTFDYLEREIIAVANSPEGKRHRWLWLTKRPERMAALSDDLQQKQIGWPDNLWAGTSVTTPATTTRIRSLLRVGDENTIRFLSVEPQWESIDLTQWLPRLDWVIQGGESGRGASPFHTEWAVDMRQQCQEAGVAYFLKQLGGVVFAKGTRIKFADGHAGTWAEWPEQLRVREMPVAGQQACSEGTGETGSACPDLDGSSKRIALNVIGVSGVRREAALKAWATRRRNEQAKQLTAVAKKALAIRRKAK